MIRTVLAGLVGLAAFDASPLSAVPGEVTTRAQRPDSTPPAWTNREQIASELRRRTLSRLLLLDGGRSATLRVRLDRHGEIMGFRLVRRTGIELLDAMLERLVARMEFRPAHVDGRPVAAVAVVRFRFEGAGR